MPLITAYLALGSNVGERLEQMRSALELLDLEGVAVMAASPVYDERCCHEFAVRFPLPAVRCMLCLSAFQASRDESAAR